jgi:hypothetical protein
VGRIFDDGSIGDASGQLVGQLFSDGSVGGMGLDDLT